MALHQHIMFLQVFFDVLMSKVKIVFDPPVFWVVQIDPFMMLDVHAIDVFFHLKLLIALLVKSSQHAIDAQLLDRWIRKAVSSWEKEVASFFGVESMGAKNMAALKLAQQFAAESDHRECLN